MLRIHGMMLFILYNKIPTFEIITFRFIIEMKYIGYLNVRFDRSYIFSEISMTNIRKIKKSLRC